MFNHLFLFYSRPLYLPPSPPPCRVLGSLRAVSPLGAPLHRDFGEGSTRPPAATPFSGCPAPLTAAARSLSPRALTERGNGRDRHPPPPSGGGEREGDNNTPVPAQRCPLRRVGRALFTPSAVRRGHAPSRDWLCRRKARAVRPTSEGAPGVMDVSAAANGSERGPGSAAAV